MSNDDFCWNPEGAQAWADGVIDFLNGPSNSVRSCSNQFSEQVRDLIEGRLWVGSAARQNYKNFYNAQEALKNFTDKFGRTFSEAMDSISVSIARMESNNLGSDTNAATAFGDLTYDEIEEIANLTVDDSITKYSKNKIVGIADQLGNILNTLQGIQANLEDKVKELNRGDETIWDGEAAEETKQTLSRVLNEGMNEIHSTFTTCINNVRAAAENAISGDRAA
ncbi:MAG: hypothetical protein K2M17_04555 [Bacilli bacterium]|nr:hypothetical protein [Bacilli bacterium]